MILPHIITQNTCRMRPPVKKETEAYVTKAWWWWKKEKKNTGETLTVCELLCVKVAEWKKCGSVTGGIDLALQKKKDRDTPELQVDTQDSWRNNWCRVANKENSPSATAVFVNPATRRRETQSSRLMNYCKSLTTELRASGRKQRGHRREKKAERDKERERIPPVLTSAPETRNGCKPVLKKGREVWEGELEGSQKAYLKDLSCMVT